jgi:hypothetical protein
MRSIFTFIVAFTLSACGGSGGSSGSTSPTPTPVTPPAPVLELLAGSPVEATFADGKGSAARFESIGDMAVDGDGNLVVRDQNRIRKVTPAGDVSTVFTLPAPQNLTAIAVRGNERYFTAVECTSSFIDPKGTCKGGLYADDGSPGGHQLRAVFQPVAVAALAAGGWILADLGFQWIPSGAPSVIKLDAALSASGMPVSGTGVAVTSDGSVFVNGLLQLSKVNASGSVSTLATWADQSGGYRIAVDTAGSVYVAVREAPLVRRVGADGTVRTIVGTEGFNGFTPGPLPGTITQPYAVAVSGTNLYIGMKSAIAVVRNRP